jgi:hypothetical protein
MVILGAGFWGFPHFRDLQKRPGGRSKAMAVSGAPGVEEDLQRPIHRIHRSGFGSGETRWGSTPVMGLVWEMNMLKNGL